MITPNADAIASGITFRMNFDVNSASPGDFEYEGNGEVLGEDEDFNVARGTSTGVYQGQEDCQFFDLSFTVKSNLQIPDITQRITFDTCNNN